MQTTQQPAESRALSSAGGEIRAEQIRLLYQHAAGTYLATLGGATIAVLLLWRHLPAPQLGAWFSFALALTAGRFWLLLRYRRAAPVGVDLERWGRYFTAGSWAAAALWGSAAFVLFVPGEAHYGAFVVILIAGMMAGSGFSLSAHRPTFHAFILPVGIALTARLLGLAGLDDDYGVTMLALAALVVLFVPLVYFFGRHSEANLVTLLDSRWRNRQLSMTLTAKLAELEQSHRSLEEEMKARLESERVLRENEDKLRLFELVISTTESAVAFTDPLQRDNPVVYVNPAFTRMTGYAAKDALGRNLRFLTADAENADDVARLREAMRAEAPCSLVVRSLRRDGTPFWSEMRISPLRDEHDRVVRFVIIQNDVTARVEMEAALRKARDELQSILDNAPAVIYTKDLDGRMVMVNRQWRQVFKAAPEDVAGKRVHEIFPRVFADVMHAKDLAVLESGKPVQFEHEVPRDKGVAVHLTIKFPLRDAAGRIYGICGIDTDITERKREQVLQGAHHRVSRVIAESSTLQEAMRRVLHVVCEATPWDWGAVYLVDRQSAELKRCDYWCDPKLERSDLAHARLSNEALKSGLLGRAQTAREPVWLADLTRAYDERSAQAAAAGLHTAVAIPIFVDSGAVGVLEFYGYEKREPERQFLRMARSIGQQLGQFAKRRDAEEQILRTEQRLELALKGSELAMWDWNIATGVIYLSPRWAEMLGAAPAPTHTTLEGLTKLAHPDDVPAIRRAIISAFKGRSQHYAVVHRVRTATGGWMWIQSSGKVVERDAGGHALRMAGTNADVTARIEAEEQLRRTRNELQAILDNSPAMIYAKDLKGEILVTNRATLADHDRDTGGHPAAKGLHPHDTAVIDARRPLQTEELVLEEDGAHTYICTRFPLRHVDNGVYGVCAIATDITDRKRMEAALGESEDRFRQFAESVNVGFWILDTGPGTLAYHNPALRRILGASDDELGRFEQRKLALVHEEDRESVRGTYASWLTSDAAARLDIDYRIAHPDGEARWLHDHAVKLHDAGGRAFRVLGITEDVTERKAGEEELRQTRAFLESVIEHLPITIFVKDAADLRYVSLNRAGEALLGLTRDKLVGRRDQDVFPPDIAESYARKDREALAAGAVIDIPEELIETRQQGRRYLHTKKIPIMDGGGVARYILGISEDVTERKQASEAIHAMNAALAKKAADLAASNEELEAFAYSVSHDLRAPLRHVNGFINLLRDHIGEGLDATSVRYLGKIQAASGRMSALIDELLALSRMSRMEMRYVRISLERLVKEVMQELSGQIKDRTVEWVVGSLPYVYGDRLLLRQAFVNLLDNAVKYTSECREARIEVGAADGDGDGDEVTVFVRDNGVGFDMKYAHKLFGVFQRLHRQEDFPGTGIGLAHVRRIVERHGGRVWAQGAIGHGAVFYVALPKGKEN